MKKLRLGIFIDGEFIPSYSGAANRFQYMSRALQASSLIDVVVFVCDRGWCDYEKIKQESFKTYCFRPEEFYFNKTLISTLLEKEKIDIIQFPNLDSCVAVGFDLSHKTNTRIILESHYDDFDFSKQLGLDEKHLSKIQNLQKIFGKYLDGVINLSKEDLLLSKNNLYIKDPERLCVNPSGIDASLPNTHNRLTKKIVFLGNMYFGPNIQGLELIDKFIFEELTKKGYTFYIGGDIHNDLKSFYIEKGFHILGPIENLTDFFSNSTIALCPILQDSGIRIKILNYMASGIPVVTTSKGVHGLPFFNSLLVQDDFSSWPALIDSFISDVKKYEENSKEVQKLVKENFSWDLLAKNLVLFYQKIYSKKFIKKELAFENSKKIDLHEPAWIIDIQKRGRFHGLKSKIPFGKYMYIEDNLFFYETL